MKVLRTSALYLAALAAIAATMIFVPAGNRAQAEICPFVIYQVCLKEKDGFKHTAWTNECFAKQMGAKILYKGPCK
jgi:hypothetical protein